MKRIIAKQKHYQSLLHTLHSHPEFSEGKAGILQTVVDLETRQQRISEILSDIIRPVSIFYKTKQYAEEQLNDAMLAFTSLGCLAAVCKNDNNLHFIMKAYQAQLHKVSAFRLHLNAIHVADMFQQIDTGLGGADFHNMKLPAFRKQVEDFGIKLNDLREQLLSRKAMKKELADLIADTNLLIRDQLDALVEFQKDKHPHLYREYMLVRHPQKRKNRTVKKIQSESIAGISTIHILDLVPAMEAENTVRVIETLQKDPLPEFEPGNKVTDEINAEIENEIPAEFLTQISELIYPLTLRN